MKLKWWAKVLAVVIFIGAIMYFAWAAPFTDITPSPVATWVLVLVIVGIVLSLCIMAIFLVYPILMWTESGSPEKMWAWIKKHFMESNQ